MVDEQGSNPQAGRLLPRVKGHVAKDERALGAKNEEPQLFLGSHQDRSSLWRRADYITALLNHKIRLICPNTIRARRNSRNRAVKLPIATRLRVYNL
jgi:hypothetical protein